MSPEKLAETLFQVFSEKGYASTSIADLTQATGMKPASLYLAFGNKEGMYAAALAYYREYWLAELSQRLEDKSISFVERIHEFFLAAYAIFSCEGKPAGCIMTFSALAFQTSEEGLALQLRDERQAFSQWLEEEARQAQRAGELAEHLSPEAFACLILTLERGLALTALEAPNGEAIKEMIDAVMKNMFHKG